MLQEQAQPYANPSSLPDPIPGKSALDDFMASQSASIPSPKTNSGGGTSALDAFMSKQESPQQFPGEGYVRGALEALPAAGAVVGGAAAAAAGGIPSLGLGAAPAAVVGAAGGGVAGTSLRDYLKSAIFNEGPQSREEQYKNLAAGGIQEATNQMGGAAVGKVAELASPIAKKAFFKGVEIAAGGNVPPDVLEHYIKAPAMVKAMALQSGGEVPVAANMVREGMQTAINQTVGDLERPAMEMLTRRASPLTDRETGDSIKSLIKGNIDQRYGKFKEAYQNLGEISKSVPIADESRHAFGEGLSNWAIEEFPQSSKSYGVVKRYQDAFQASNNGAQFESVIRDLKDEASVAYRSGEFRKAEMLQKLQDKATGFLEDQTTSLAKRIQMGKASPQEAQFASAMAQQRGLPPEEGLKYTKNLAKDYLANKDAVRNDYAAFKSFMEDTVEQTKVRGSGRSTINFLDKMDSVPSEKLVERMMDPKNSRALQTMKRETPEVFQSISDYKVKKLVENASPDGNLDLGKFHSDIMKLQPEIRHLLFAPEDLQALQATVSNPRYVKINELRARIPEGLITPNTAPDALLAAGRPQSQHAIDLGELSRLTGQNFMLDAKNLAAMNTFAKNPTTRKELLKLGVNAAKLAEDFLPLTYGARANPTAALQAPSMPQALMRNMTAEVPAGAVATKVGTGVMRALTPPED